MVIFTITSLYHHQCAVEEAVHLFILVKMLRARCCLEYLVLSCVFISGQIIEMAIVNPLHLCGKCRRKPPVGYLLTRDYRLNEVQCMGHFHFSIASLQLKLSLVPNFQTIEKVTPSTILTQMIILLKGQLATERIMIERILQ